MKQMPGYLKFNIRGSGGSRDQGLKDSRDYVDKKTSLWPHNHRGFTLLELVISITLISILVLVLSMSLRTGIRAWARGKAENEKLLTLTAVESLLGRQLRAAVRTGEEMGNMIYFSGTDHELSFVTTHMPMGSFLGGMCLVVYRFDESEKALIYAQKIVTRKDDIDESLPSDFKEEKNSPWLVSKVPGISSLEFAYTDDEESLTPESWKRSWEKDKLIPIKMALSISISSKENNQEKNWRIFSTEPFIIQ